MNNEKEKILYKDLSYKLQGLFFDIRNELGSGHKETIYQKALEKKMIAAGLPFKKEPAIKVYSPKKEFLGLYRPDFLIDEKIIIETKAVTFVTKQENARMYDYLRSGEYEIAYLVNFASPELYVRRFIYTNDRKSWLKTFLVFVAICYLFVGIRGLNVEAANFFIESPKLVVGQETMIVLNLDTEGDDINAVELRLKFSSSDFSIKEISNGNSIINLWPESPSFSNEEGEIYFSGVMAGGYRGSSGQLLKISVIPKKEDLSGSLKIQNSRILLNDGSGTESKLSTSNLKFETVDNLNFKDSESPESFVPQIARNQDIFDGKWFLVFAAQDKGSGIGHYEVREMPQYLFFKNPEWVVAESPYKLANQELSEYIYVKAVDKSGNERVMTVPPRNPARWYENWLIWIIIMAIAFVIIGKYQRFRIYANKK